VPLGHGVVHVRGGHGVPADCGHGRGRVASDVGQFKSYDEPDVSNPILPFAPPHPVGCQFGQPYHDKGH